MQNIKMPRLDKPDNNFVNSLLSDQDNDVARVFF